MQVTELLLPESLEKFVEQEVAEGGYESPERYIRHLIAVEHKRRAKERLQALMEEGLNSEPELVTAEWWAELRADIERDSKACTG
jgi:antitoxin ParD1/3/4